MQVNAYLNFNGQCEAAFKCYEQCLGAEIGTIFRYAGTPLAESVPANWHDKVMHGTLTVGGQMMMGGDVAPIVPFCTTGLSRPSQRSTWLSFPKVDTGAPVLAFNATS